MRKLGVLLAGIAALICFNTVQATAADDLTLEQRVKALESAQSAVNLYGSIRFESFYEQSTQNYNDVDGATSGLGADDRMTRFGVSDVSRIGVTVNKGAIGGKVELGLNPDSSSSPKTRLAFGTYTHNDVTFLFGQDWTPLGDWSISNQVFYADNGLSDFGVMDELRTPQIKIIWKGLQVAFVEPNKTNTCGLDDVTDDAHQRVLLPRFEVKYGQATEKFFYDVFAGYSTYKVKSSSLDIDKNVNSFAYGIDGGVTFSPVFINAHVWAAQNGVQEGLITANSLSGAQFDTDGDLENSKDFGYALVAGVTVDKITFEAGYGFSQSKNDAYGDGGADNARSYYLQAAIPIAQTDGAKFFVVPEVGVIDYMKDANYESEGKATYAGAKWQINF